MDITFASVLNKNQEANLYLTWTFYPLLYKLEECGLIRGRLHEKARERRRRFYKITAQGCSALLQHRLAFDKFVAAVAQVLGGKNA